MLGSARAGDHDRKYHSSRLIIQQIKITLSTGDRVALAREIVMWNV